MNTHVIKVGGENASDLRTAEWLATQSQNGEKIAVAISALRTKSLKTTDELLRAQDAFSKNGIQSARTILENLFQVHIETLKEAGMFDDELYEKLRELFEWYFPVDLELGNDIQKEQQFIGYGEVMSAHVLSHILATRFQIKNSLVTHAFTQNVNSTSSLSEILKNSVGKQVDLLLPEWIVIVPWYVSVDDKSILEYGRWYTDKMAERIAVWLSDLGHSPILHIQKQVPLLSSHPGNTTGTRVISDMSHWTAAEITGARWANAQVLNEHTISSDLAKRNIPVWVYNPFDTTSGKSIISENGNPNSWILFIDGRDHVSTITVSGFAMSWAGLLSKLTTVFLEQKISIDSISSSETEVTFTAYGELSQENKMLLSRKIEEVLGEQYTIEVKNNLWLIYCIGDNLVWNPWLLSKITTILADESIDIECISQSRGQRAVTIGVHSDNLKKGVQILHENLIALKY